MASRFPDYFNRFTAAKQWEKVLFRAGHGGLQSAELNELQDVLASRIDALGLGIYQDGHVVSGADCTVLPEMASPSIPPAANIRIGAGRIALRGTVYDVPETSLLIANNKLVWVGIRFTTVEQDEFDDPDLLNPAVGTRGYDEPGAGRLQAQWQWGWKADDNTEDANSDWDFYPVFEIDHGVIVVRAVPPNGDPMLNLLAKYDREAHGNYVVRGFGVTFTGGLDSTATPVTGPSSGAVQYAFDIGAGLADIQGFKTERHPDTKMVWNRDPTLVSVTGEPHHYDGGLVIGHPPPTPPPPTGPSAPYQPPPGGVPAGGRETILLNKSPIAGVTRILATLYKEGTASRSMVANGQDSIIGESNPIGTIISVVKSGTPPNTVYTKGVDWKQTADKIDWNVPGGSEPAGGTTLEVGYTYVVDITILPPGVTVNPNVVSIDVSSVTVTGLYPDSYIYVDYSWAVPRKDLLVLDVEGNIDRLLGVSQIRNPTAPHPSEDQVALATVEYDWMNDPKVVEISPRTIPMTELHTMKDHIFDLYELVAIIALRGDQGLRGEAEHLGIFVDPFISEDTRDYGLLQLAVTADGALQLPVPSLPYLPDGAAESSYQTLAIDHLEELASQQAKTGCLAIVPIFVVPPPVIPPPPPPPPIPHTKNFSLMGAGGSAVRSNAIIDAVENPYVGIRWFMNSNRAHYRPMLDSVTRLDCSTFMDTLKAADLTTPGTYWGDHTPGVPNANHNRSGTFTNGVKTYTWFTRITERIFTNPPINLRAWFGTWPNNAGGDEEIYEIGGAIPSDASINAVIAATIPQLRASDEITINAWGGWSPSTKSQLIAQLVFFCATPVLKDQSRWATWAINNNVYNAWQSAQFQPNYRWDNVGHQWIHRLTIMLYGCGPRDETEPSVSAAFWTTCDIRGVYDVPPDSIPPRRHIHAPPPTLPDNTPPVVMPPALDDETFADPDSPLRFTATGFKPDENVANAVVDGVTLPVLPRDDDDGSTATTTTGVDV